MIQQSAVIHRSDDSVGPAVTEYKKRGGEQTRSVKVY